VSNHVSIASQLIFFGGGERERKKEGGMGTYVSMAFYCYFYFCVSRVMSVQSSMFGVGGGKREGGQTHV
jgi:hypothetical protein